MDTVLDVALGVFVLVVLTWVLIMGGIGALLSRSRGGGIVSGLALGVVGGPFGWAYVAWRTRASRRPVSGDTFVADADPLPSPAPRASGSSFSEEEY
jgi:hypothetical protein